VAFVIEPYTRFKGQTCEQSTMLFLDPTGNALEFKAFESSGQLFAADAPSHRLLRCLDCLPRQSVLHLERLGDEGQRVGGLFDLLRRGPTLPVAGPRFNTDEHWRGTRLSVLQGRGELETVGG